MKKITLLLLMLISLHSKAQISKYSYHELIDLGTTIERAIQVVCTKTRTPRRLMEVNLKQNHLLEVGKVYKVDLGLNYGNYGTRYYKVKYASRGGTDKGDEIQNPPDFGQPINVCETVSLKYHRLFYVGKSLSEAKSNTCGVIFKLPVIKTNILLKTPLLHKRIYKMDFGFGLNYYYMDGSGIEKGDADYTINNISSIELQTDVCQTDSDNDGTPDFKDNCPTQTGPSSNNGCPIKDSDNDGVPDSEDNCPNEAGSTSNNGCPASNEPAKIEIQNIVVKKSSDDKVVFNSEVNNSKLILNNNNDYSIEVEIKNVGGEIQKKIMWVIAESRDNKFNQFNDCINTGGGSAEYSINLAPDEVKTEKKEISIYDSIMALCTVKQSGYLIVSINNDIYYSIPYNYSSESSESRSLATNSQTIKQKPYIIDVYNFKGQKVLSREVKNVEEENKATLSLPKGIYIIKSKNGDRKIYID